MCVSVPCVETAGVAVTPAGRKPRSFSCLPSPQFPEAMWVLAGSQVSRKNTTIPVDKNIFNQSSIL